MDRPVASDGLHVCRDVEARVAGALVIHGVWLADETCEPGLILG